MLSFLFLGKAGFIIGLTGIFVKIFGICGYLLLKKSEGRMRERKG
jgi:hypothetical protein